MPKRYDDLSVMEQVEFGAAAEAGVIIRDLMTRFGLSYEATRRWRKHWRKMATERAIGWAQGGTNEHNANPTP